MNMGILKLISSVVLLSLVSGTSYAKVHYFKKGYANADTQFTYLSLHPELKPVGPTYDYTAKELGKNDFFKMRQEYTTVLYGLLVRAANDYMEENKEFFFSSKTGNAKPAYWSFLLGAIAIPHHESGFMHIRKTDPSKCDVYLNTPKWLDKKLTSNFSRSKQAKKYAAEIKNKKDSIKNFLYNDKSPILPACDYLQYSNPLHQLIIANTDVGLMQINMDQHSKFWEADSLFNIYRHIDYAIDLWADSFKKLWNERRSTFIENDDGDILCDLSDNPYTVKGGDRENFLSQVTLALWSGKHNQGNIRLKSICRNQLQTAGHKKDKTFLAETLYPLLNLPEHTLPQKERRKDGSIYNYEASYKSILDTYLKKNSPEKASLEEIRSAFAANYGVEGMEKVRKPINSQIVANNYRSYYQVEGNISVNTNDLTPTDFKGDHYLNSKKLNIYLAPSVNSNYTHCGIISADADKYILLKKDESQSVFNFDRKLPTGTTVKETWIKVIIPGLRNYKVDRSTNDNPLCREKSLWVLASVGNQNFLQKAGYSEEEIKYGIGLNGRISNYLRVRSEPNSKAKHIGNLWKKNTPDGGWSVTKEYRSEFNQKYPHWVKVEYKHQNKTKTGWIPSDFIEIK